MWRFPRRRLLAESRGATTVEFALISPVLLMMLMGTWELGYNLYASMMLQGVITKAGRDSTIEGAGSTTGTIDQSVTDRVRQIVPNATLAFTRKSYSSLGNVSRPEDFTDNNTNGTCDGGEPFEDANGNGTWDSDRGRNGIGGARDAVLYTVTMTYPRTFAMAKLAGFSTNVTITAQTILRNQPYSLQQITVTTGNC